MMTTEISQTSSAPWSAVGKWLFRFSFVYGLLYNFPFPLTELPLAQPLLNFYDDAWNVLVVWVGRVVFGQHITIRPAGSGDTTWNYVQLFCSVLLALLATIVWSLADRKRANYVKLWQWLNFYLRFALAAALIAYGAVKVIKAQFPDLTIDALAQPLGDCSPMGLLWKFMGASWLFNVFTGTAEMLGGLLLTMRRTTLLGALVSIAVLSNVVVLNLSYDVPVKLYSMHLLAMAVFLVVPDARRLANLFWFHRPVAAATLTPLFATARRNRVANIVAITLVIAFTGWNLLEAWQDRQEIHAHAARSPLYGLWNVEEFEVNGQSRPPLLTDEDRWRRLVFDRPDLLVIQLTSDVRARYQLELEAETKVLRLRKRSDPQWRAELSYERSGEEQLLLTGSFGTETIRARLRRVPTAQYSLVSRGFHWINEFSNNR
jgi:hypothetical protein